jgi:hypothetical protein
LTQIRTTYVRHAFKLLDDSVLNLVHNDITLDMDAALKEQGDLYHEGTRYTHTPVSPLLPFLGREFSDRQAVHRFVSSAAGT